jgi:hypothetical protein
MGSTEEPPHSEDFDRRTMSSCPRSKQAVVSYYLTNILQIKTWTGASYLRAARCECSWHAKHHNSPCSHMLCKVDFVSRRGPIERYRRNRVANLYSIPSSVSNVYCI